MPVSRYAAALARPKPKTKTERSSKNEKRKRKNQRAMKSNGERLVQLVKSLPPGPLPRDIDATIRIARRMLDDLDDDEFNIAFENAVDELQSHVIIMLHEWQPEGKPS